jgi:DNA-binding beta-propeller fold protein YncE
LRRLVLCLLLGVASTANALAQDAPAAPVAPRAIRAPDVPNPPGTDSGNGPACSKLTAYGSIQPPGPPAVPYGAGAPAPAPVAAPVYAPPNPARQNSNLGASNMEARGIVTPDVPVLPWQFVEPPQPPSGSAGFANVNSVQLLKNGRLIVNQRMPMYQWMEYDAGGRLMRVFDPDLVGRPHGMRIDSHDNIWVTDQQCNVVMKLNSQGEVLLTLGTVGKAGTWDEAKGDHLFNQPTDIAFAPNGDIFVSNGHGGPDPRVLRFDKNGKYITSWSMARSDPSQPIIHTLIVHKNEVWVGDRELKLIKVFDFNGKLLRQIQMQNLICGLYVDSKGQLWLTTGQDGMILRLDWNGKVLGRIGKEGYGVNDFGEAHYMTITPDGTTMYVSDTVNNNIKKLKLVK